MDRNGNVTFFGFLGMCIMGLVFLVLKVAFIIVVACAFVICAMLFKEHGLAVGGWGMVIIAFLVGGPIGVIAMFTFCGKR
jgi:hypothetical protein